MTSNAGDMSRSSTTSVMASNAGDLSRSSTTIVAVRSYHELKIEGYSKTLSTDGSRPSFNSRPFRAGAVAGTSVTGPWGSPHQPENTDHISFYTILDDNIEEAVMAQITYNLLDHDKKPVHMYTRTTVLNDYSMSKKDWGFGIEEFIKRDDLERSDYLKDDCFTVSVHVHIAKEAPTIVVPQSDMRQHLGDLLSSKEGTDVEFQVRGEMFAAHRLILGARSPVFWAQLFGSMEEGTTKNVIEIDDMEAQVFDALLVFVYTDELPRMEAEDECAMTQHLLVAADRYSLPRLKLMCEDRLRHHVDTFTAATILVLAQKHHCPSLTEACFDFLSSSKALLAVTESNEFDYLAQSCPCIVKELFSLHLSRIKED